MCMYEWVHVWMHESRNKLMSGFINEWMTEAFMPIDGWMIEWMNLYNHCFSGLSMLAVQIIDPSETH